MFADPPCDPASPELLGSVPNNFLTAKFYKLLSLPFLLILVASNSISSSVLGLYDTDTAIFPLSPPPQPLCLCFSMLLLFLQAHPVGSVTSSFLF